MILVCGLAKISRGGKAKDPYSGNQIKSSEGWVLKLMVAKEWRIWEVIPPIRRSPGWYHSCGTETGECPWHLMGCPLHVPWGNRSSNISSLAIFMATLVSGLRLSCAHLQLNRLPWLAADRLTLLLNREQNSLVSAIQHSWLPVNPLNASWGGAYSHLEPGLSEQKNTDKPYLPLGPATSTERPRGPFMTMSRVVDWLFSTTCWKPQMPSQGNKL